MAVLDKDAGQGRIAIYDGSWYRRVLIDRFEKRTKNKDLPAAFHSINSFEEQLVEDGNLIIKLFLDIDKKNRRNGSISWKRIKRQLGASARATGSGTHIMTSTRR